MRSTRAGKQLYSGINPTFIKSVYPLRFFSTRSSDEVLSSVPPLTLLEEMAIKAKENGFPSLEDTAIIGVQHILPTTASMFDVIIDRFGVNPKDIYLTGKFYSSCPSVEAYMLKRGINLMPNKIPRKPGQFEEQIKDSVYDMWCLLDRHLKQQKKKRVIIFDEGAHCLDTMPKWIRYENAFASMEQTRFGLYSKTVGTKLFPTIDVACSITKKKLESPLIAKAVLRRLKEALDKLNVQPKTIFGVVGNGSIGSAVTKHLLSLNHKVVVYDESRSAFQTINHRNCFRVDSIASVIEGVDILFGCTGRDITKNINVFEIVNKNPITFVSFSSQDIEFQTLLKAMSNYPVTEIQHETFSCLKYVSENDSGTEINILEKGFPFNFDRTFACDPVTEMELTRGLLFGGFIQAALEAKTPIDDGKTLNQGEHLMLDPYIQHFVATHWLKKQPKSEHNQEQIDCFDSIDWIKGNSGGEYHQNDFLKESFSDYMKKYPAPSI